MKPLLAVCTVLLVLAGAAWAQGTKKEAPGRAANNEAGSAVFASAAYSEIALKKAELTAELESLRSEYTEEYPKIKESVQAIEFLKVETERLKRLGTASAASLTPALGKLIVRKVDLEVELWRLLQAYKEDHPDVKRAKTKVAAFEAAIREILGQ